MTTVPMSQVCEQGMHHQCQGHDATGGCACPAPVHKPAEDLHAAIRALQTDPLKAGVSPVAAEPLIGWLTDTARDLSTAKTIAGRFSLCDEPQSAVHALRFARFVNSTTGDPS